MRGYLNDNMTLEIIKHRRTHGTIATIRVLDGGFCAFSFEKIVSHNKSFIVLKRANQAHDIIDLKQAIEMVEQIQW